MQTPLVILCMNLLLIGVGTGCAAAWLIIAVRWHNEGTALPYEPRQQVPWNWLGAGPAFSLVTLALYRAIWGDFGTTQGGPNDDFVWQAATGLVFSLALLAALIVLVAGISHATRRDLGLPLNAREFGRDVMLGAIGWLAALAPVFALQGMLVYIYQDSSQHPLIEAIQANPDPKVFVAAFLSAVFIAPIMEEVVFRLLLQGWLERVEDRAIGIQSTEREAVQLSSTEAENGGKFTEEALEEQFANMQPVGAARGKMLGISRGFIPIVISSVLFSVAHIGFDHSPVAIFVLALFLGYLYQRTHRIVPCIALHMLFNGLSLFYLWLWLQLPQPIIQPN